MEIGILPNAAMLLLLSRVLFLVVTMAYYYHLGRKPKKIWAVGSVRDFQGGGGGEVVAAEHRSYMRGSGRLGILFDWGSERPLSPPASNRQAQRHTTDSAARTRNLLHWAVRSSPSWHTFLLYSVPSAVSVTKELLNRVLCRLLLWFNLYSNFKKACLRSCTATWFPDSVFFWVLAASQRRFLLTLLEFFLFRFFFTFAVRTPKWSLNICVLACFSDS